MLSLFCLTSGYSQNYPFHQNSIYKYGIYPLNRNHADVDSVYVNWKASHITGQGSGGYRRVLWDTLRATVSEGIGYGMLISVNMNDQTLFNSRRNYYNSSLKLLTLIQHTKPGNIKRLLICPGSLPASISAVSNQLVTQILLNFC